MNICPCCKTSHDSTACPTPEMEGVGCDVLFGTWLPIKTAPKDGTEIIVYCPPAHGLNHMASVCAWHEDAGFCVCELREPTLWIPLPNARDQQPMTTTNTTNTPK